MKISEQALVVLTYAFAWALLIGFIALVAFQEAGALFRRVTLGLSHKLLSKSAPKVPVPGAKNVTR